MAEKKEVKNFNLYIEEGTFTGHFKRLRGKKSGFDFSGISALRKLLSNERARILHTIKIKDPDSIYHLAKLLKRDFKSVRQDVKLLERFGFIDLDSKRKGKREMLKPILAVDAVSITINL